uniref:Uncharacterized protein n=1 Tax=Sinocyclocheilus rhinocerous TaxID=307959 RepID=A0A673FX72_9TELE
MSPISKTVAIFVAGRETASLSRLASNRGLYRRTGKRCANVGISFGIFCSASIFFCSSVLLASICCIIFSLVENIWKRTASHIFAALGESLLSWLSVGLASASDLFWTSFFDAGSSSGNLGSSASTTICFLRRDQPLSFDFMPFGFCITFKRGSAVREEPSSPSSFFSTADLISCCGLAFVSTLSTFSGSVSFVSRLSWSSFVLGVVGVLSFGCSFGLFCIWAFGFDDSSFDRFSVALSSFSCKGSVDFTSMSPFCNISE